MKYKFFIVSIHAPAWGATIPEGDVWGLMLVSIHAPAWARLLRLNLRLVFCMFQSTRPRGARRDLCTNLCDLSHVQSTRPRGARDIATDIFLGDFVCFNPRARVGRDISAIAPIP